MRIAVGIIALVAGLLASLQSCAISIGSDLGGDAVSAQAGGAGILVGFMLIVGGAFAFGLPTVSLVVFTLAAALGFLAASEGGIFTDLEIWSWGAVVLAVLSILARRQRGKAPNRASSDEHKP
jgi:hypothetical protein